MSPSEGADFAFEIRAILRRINDTWLRGPSDDIPAKLEECFDGDVIFDGPGFAEIAQGKSACIEGYVDFARSARIAEANLSEPVVRLFGDEAAVATYDWRLRYELHGEAFDESGHDVFLFVRRGGAWRAVWRAMLPEPRPPE